MKYNNEAIYQIIFALTISPLQINVPANRPPINIFLADLLEEKGKEKMPFAILSIAYALLASQIPFGFTMLWEKKNEENATLAANGEKVPRRQNKQADRK